jgi:HSP20 family molecular chaperone IbpA
MAFFPRSLYNSNADTSSSFHPLVRLLDDFDNYSRHGQGKRSGPGLPTWQPKFDIRETADAYELHGELPGMVKENVNIEFTDPQTMHIRGRVERTYTAGSAPRGGHLEDGNTRGAVTEGGEDNHRRNSHQATVEDENASKDSEHQQVTTTNDGSSKKQADKAKYWLTERSIGEFSRSFSFPTRVEQDGVSANLKDGILSVTVPKAKKHEARRIAIN